MILLSKESLMSFTSGFLFKAIALCCITIAITVSSRGQTPEELEKEKLKTQVLQEQEKQAKAEQGIREAKFGKPAPTPLEGKTTVDANVVIEANVLAHDAAAEIAKKIAEEIGKAGAKKIIIHNNPDVLGLISYKSFKARVEHFQNQYRDLLSGAPAPLLLGPGDIVRTAVDLLSFFRTDIDIKGVTLTVEESAVVAELARHGLAQTKKIEVYYPALFPPFIAGAKPIEESPLLVMIEELFRSRGRAKAEIARRQQMFEALKPQIQQAQAAGNTQQAQALLAEQAEHKAIADKLTKLNEQVDKFLDDLMKPDEKTGSNLLTTLIKAEGFMGALECDDCRNNYVLFLKIQKSGGGNMTTRNLFTSIFTVPNLYHTGSSIVSYMLFDRTGLIKAGGTLFNNNPRTKNRKVKDNLSRHADVGSVFNK